MDSDKTQVLEETAAMVLEGKYMHRKLPSCYTLEVYRKRTIFILVDMTEDMVKSIA